jgi:hypothetical protein
LDNGYSGYAEIVLEGSTVIPPTLPREIKATLSGGKLIVTGANGTTNAAYSVLTTTNLVTPNWTVSATGTLDGTGALSNSIPVNRSQPAEFFLFRIP